MNITACAGISTTGVDCMHDFQPSCDYIPSKIAMNDFTATFGREMCELPNPYALTFKELAYYIEYVTDWPSVVELQNGAASINSPVILKALSIVHQEYEYKFSDGDIFHNYSKIKKLCYDMIECIRAHLMEMIGEENVQCDEFKHTKKLLSFFEAMAIGDRSHVDRFIHTFSI